MNIRPTRAALSALILSAAISLTQAAPPPGTTVLPPIDLSPGYDVRNPEQLALNRSSHKLYVGARPITTGLKVIDTTTGKVTGGFSFGSYPGARPLQGIAMAIDESAGPDGNKLYVGGMPSSFYVLRIIDGATDKELTGRGTDIILPIVPYRIVVNPRNHKVYISNYAGHVVVVDGVSRTVLTSLSPDAGSFLAVDPVANKVFVLGANGGAIIDSATDTVSPPPKPLLFIPTCATFNEADQLIYLGGYRHGHIDTKGVFVLDGKTGRLAASRTFSSSELRDYLDSIVVLQKENKIYAGSDSRILSFDMTNLSINGEIDQPAPEITFDRVNPGVMFAIQPPNPATYNVVSVINRSTGKASHRTTAYFPRKVGINTATNRIYVLDELARDMVVIDGADHSILARVQVPPASQQRSIAVSERLNRIYVTRFAAGTETDSGFNGVDVYDGATNRLRHSFKMKAEDFSNTFAVDDTRRHIYFAGARSTNSGQGLPLLDVYDEDSGTFITSIDTSTEQGFGSGNPGSLAVNPVSGRIYMSTSSHSVAVFDGTTLTLVNDAIDTGSVLPRFIGINSTTNTVYVAGSDKVAVVNGATNLVSATFSIDGESTGIVADDAADTINITEKSQLVARQGQGAHSFIGSVPLRDAEAGPAFNAATRQFFVPDVRHGMIKVIQAGDAGP